MTSHKTSSRTWLTSLLVLATIFLGLPLSGPARAQSGQHKTRQNARVVSQVPQKQRQPQALPKFAKNLTELARQGYFKSAADYENAVQQTLKVLSQSVGNTPVLIDETGTARNAVVEGVALRLVEDGVATGLPGRQLWRLDYDALISGAIDSAEVINRLRAVLAEVKSTAGQHLLYIDELPSLVGANQVYGREVAEAVRGSLADRSLSFIGATTGANYETTIANDVELGRYFAR